jgi:uncharacterized membrane protein YozB (DUF420 family)
MKAILTQPGFLGTYGNFGADISLLVSLVFTLLFLIGWRMSAQHQGNQHHILVLWAMVGMIAYYTVYYLARSLGSLATEGKEGFGGPNWVYAYIFSPLLIIHITVVTIGLVMAVYMIILGFRVAVRKGSMRVLQAGFLKMSNKAFLKMLAGALLLLGTLSAIRCATLRCLMVYVYGYLLVIVVLLLEKGIERLIADGERRHRLVGRFTMVLYLIVLFTSTTTYTLLYVIWPPKSL